MVVYALKEHNRSCWHTHAIFSSKRAAWLSGLSLKKKEVEDALDFRSLHGKRDFRGNYRFIWWDADICVEPYEVLGSCKSL